MADDVVASARERGGTKLVSLALLSIVAAVGVGWGVIKVVEAVEPTEDCGSYGYGGYGCETPFGITVVPSTDLVDRQTVTVTGSGFLPDTFFGAAQCDPSVGPDAGVDACDLSTARTSYTDGEGNVELQMPVRRIIIVQGNEVDCALSPCTLGAATLEGSTTPIQATSVPISFDPDVPAVPRLEVDLTVEHVTVSSLSGTISCNREAEAWADAFLSQEKGGHFASAYGFSEQIPCDTTPSEWTIPLQSGSGVLTGGPATYELFASAHDGFESASANVAGETRLAGGAIRTVDSEQPGETVRVEILGVSRDGSGLSADLRVTCDRPTQEGYASVEVSQRAGLDRIRGFGSVELGACDGVEEVSVPVWAYDGAFVGGPAQVRAYADVFDFGPDGEFYDFASAITGVRLSGARPTLQSPEPNPDSRIVITGANTSSLTGTVTCEEPAQVELWGVVQQLRGRSFVEGFGSDFIECDGETPFTLTFFEGDLSSGAAIATVYASAYREDGEDFQYLWDDYQAAELRIRR
ncbi:MAG: neocarzinostatin apoprotein domain-containing protein [Actinomycetota bacterium]